MINKKTGIQESQYVFPYHYIPDFENGRFFQNRDLRWGYIYLSYLGVVKDIIFKKSPSSVMDIGCGDGRFLRELRKASANINLCGVDISEQAVAYAKAFNMMKNIDFKCLDITQENELTKCSSCVTLIDTLEHIPFVVLDKFVSSVHNILKKDGFLVVTVPSKNVKVDKKHYQHFDLESLKKVLEDYFVIDEHRYLNSNNWLVKKIDRFISNKNFIVTNKTLIDWLYRCYCRNFLFVGANNCKRILGVFKKI